MRLKKSVSPKKATLSASGVELASATRTARQGIKGGDASFMPRFSVFMRFTSEIKGGHMWIIWLFS